MIQRLLFASSASSDGTRLSTHRARPTTSLKSRAARAGGGAVHKLSSPAVGLCVHATVSCKVPLVLCGGCRSASRHGTRLSTERERPTTSPKSRTVRMEEEKLCPEVHRSMGGPVGSNVPSPYLRGPPVVAVLYLVNVPASPHRERGPPHHPSRERLGLEEERSPEAHRLIFCACPRPLQQIKRKVGGEKGRCRCYERRRDKARGNFCTSPISVRHTKL